MKYEPDKLPLVSPQHVGTCAMSIVDRLQRNPPEVQLAAIGVVFVMLMQKHGVKAAGNVLQVSENILERTKTIASSELRAALTYVMQEC